MTSATAWAIRVASAEQARRQDPPVQLELEVGDHVDEVGVAGALAVAVDAALDVRRAGIDGGEGVGDRAAGVVVAVDAHADAGRLHDVVDDVGDPAGQHAAVGVAQRDDVGAGVVRRPQHLERVGPVEPVAVEEVLGVEEDLLPLGAEVADGVAHHREVLLERGAQRLLHVAGVRLGDQRHDAGTAVAQGRGQRVVGRLHAGAPGGAERGELRVPEVQLVDGAAEELGVLGVGTRPAALDVADTQPVELPGDRQLVRDRGVEALLLHAVTQGGVVDVERAVQAGDRARRLAGSSVSLGSGVSGQKKNLSETRGWRVEGLDALANDDLGEVPHASSVPRLPYGVSADQIPNGGADPGAQLTPWLATTRPSTAATTSSAPHSASQRPQLLVSG